MVEFVKTTDLTNVDKIMVSEMTGKIQLWLLESRGLDYISNELNLPPRMVLENMCETAYEFIKGAGGWKYFIKWLIRKR